MARYDRRCDQCRKEYYLFLDFDTIHKEKDSPLKIIKCPYCGKIQEEHVQDGYSAMTSKIEWE